MIARLNMTLADVFLVAALLLAAGLLLFLLPGWVLSEGTSLEIKSGDKIVGTFRLDDNRIINVQGPLGETVVKIEDGQARIVFSPCPHKICQGMGNIGKSGGVIACVPNEVVIRIGEGRTDGLDAVSR